MRRTPTEVRARGLSIDKALGGYADRGVFRGFSAEDTPRGVRRYRFHWLTRRPMTIVLSRDRRELTFPALLPAVLAVPQLCDALRAEVRSKISVALPPHRRVDLRRATISARVTKGDLELRISIAGRDGRYAVRAALGVVNDLFLFLHECYPEYLAAHFGVSQE